MLFDEILLAPPSTEGIKYAGSKLKILPYILQLAKQTKGETILDGFAGSTRVSQALAQTGYIVTANDISVWSEVLATCYLLNDKSHDYQALINHLNALPPIDGWFTEHYGGEINNGSSIQKDGLKKIWQSHNTRKLDAIRQEIEDLNLTPLERATVLTSLILALDQVDNTLGHFVSYLSEWSARSYNDLRLKLPNMKIQSRNHNVYKGDVFEVIKHVQTDIAYFDPPYGSNNEKMPPSRVRYAAYYHIWTSVCLFDKPTLFGKAKRREDSSDTIAPSIFEEFRRDETGNFIAVRAIEELIKGVNSDWVILSYNSGGRATAEQLLQSIDDNGKLIEIKKIDYKRNIMASMKWTNKWLREVEEPNQEFLFLIKK